MRNKPHGLGIDGDRAGLVTRQVGQIAAMQPDGHRANRRGLIPPHGRVAGPASLRGGMEKTQEAALRSIAYSISSARGLRRRVTLDRMARYTDAAKKIYKLAR